MGGNFWGYPPNARCPDSSGNFDTRPPPVFLKPRRSRRGGNFEWHLLPYCSGQGGNFEGTSSRVLEPKGGVFETRPIGGIDSAGAFPRGGRSQGVPAAYPA